MTIHFSEGETKELNVALNALAPLPATLQGIVVDADTSLAIAGVVVEVVGLESTNTGVDGIYSIIKIPPGSYTVRFSHPDYETVEY